MTKKELVAQITAITYAHGTASQLMRHTKETLETMLISLNNNLSAHVEDESEEYSLMDDRDALMDIAAELDNQLADMLHTPSELAEQEATAERNEALLKKFDLKRYMGYECPSNVAYLCVSPGQYNLAKSLESNFDCIVNLDECETRGQASILISAVFNEIASGRIKARPEAEVIKNLEDYRKVRMVNPATKAQLAYISELEKELNATDSIVINDTITASMRISELRKRKYAKPDTAEVLLETAVTTDKPSAQVLVEQLIKKPSFRERFANMLRGLADRID